MHDFTFLFIYFSVLLLLKTILYHLVTPGTETFPRNEWEVDEEKGGWMKREGGMDEKEGGR